MTIPATTQVRSSAYVAQCTAALGGLGEDEPEGEAAIDQRQQAAAQTLEVIAERIQPPLQRLERAHHAKHRPEQAEQRRNLGRRLQHPEMRPQSRETVFGDPRGILPGNTLVPARLDVADGTGDRPGRLVAGRATARLCRRDSSTPRERP